ncbi:hypothetical protein MoryE10_17580 [Methylogaea oryzae]|uniref:Uncharacterized protein n=2 Tax=Methylogaea oryzae TaxID=1295382 RepID=A0A8D4VP74_9GAMM|nr:hypothetical protein MoryE10_17580 [Methylogaea oryzae]
MGYTLAALAAPPGEPPSQVYEDCRGKSPGAVVQHATPQGQVAATCVPTPNGLAARPNQPRNASPRRGPDSAEGRAGEPRPRPAQNGQGGGKAYSLEQATSDHAQLNTIAFDGLAFLTGDFGYDTFLPPGKVSDYFGFQYMRDIDARGGGHNTSFLTRIANNVLSILNNGQKAQLLALADEQQADIQRFAMMRLPLIKAFRLNLEGRIPAGSDGLDRQAVVDHSMELYAIDGRLAYRRAQVMADILRRLDDGQKAALSRLKFGDSSTWPDVPEPLERRGMSHEADVAVMTYASEMFSWYAGSLEADTYFCPERHGMYFGGFGMKTAPAMGKRDYAISTSLTGDSGESFLTALFDSQRRAITGLVELQRRDLAEIVQVRRDIAAELRRFLQGGVADQAKVLALSRRYGALDGDLSYLYAKAFAEVGQTLTEPQKRRLSAMRADDPSVPKGPFLYSTPIAPPDMENTGVFFGASR